MPTSTSDHKLCDVLDDLIPLRPFPATASRLMCVCDGDAVTAGEISQIISHDPALALKLLLSSVTWAEIFNAGERRA